MHFKNETIMNRLRVGNEDNVPTLKKGLDILFKGIPIEFILRFSLISFLTTHLRLKQLKLDP